jgi:hypothetical protein
MRQTSDIVEKIAVLAAVSIGVALVFYAYLHPWIH